MLCVCHTTLTQNDPVCCFLSGWATTAGRLLGPKIVLGVFLKDSDALASGVKPRFWSLSITSQPGALQTELRRLCHLLLFV